MLTNCRVLYRVISGFRVTTPEIYVINEKGPPLDSLPGVKKFEPAKIAGSMKVEIPYKYVGIMHIKDPELFGKEGAPSKKFQDFAAKFKPWSSPVFRPSWAKK